MSEGKENLEQRPGAGKFNFRVWLDDLERRAEEYAVGKGIQGRTSSAHQIDKELSRPVPAPGAEVFIDSLKDKMQELQVRLGALRQRMAQGDKTEHIKHVQELIDDINKFLGMSRILKDFSQELQDDWEGFNEAIENVSATISDLEDAADVQK